MRIQDMTIAERYRFYRSWHTKPYAAILSVDILPLLLFGALAGFFGGVFL